MMKKIIILFVFTISAMLHSPVSAQVNKVLTLREAVSLAEENNSDIVKSRLDLMIAKTVVSEAYADNLIPSLTLTSNYTRAFKKQVFTIFGENIEIGTDNTILNTLY